MKGFKGLGFKAQFPYRVRGGQWQSINRVYSGYKGIVGKENGNYYSNRDNGII